MSGAGVWLSGVMGQMGLKIKEAGFNVSSIGPLHLIGDKYVSNQM